MFGTCAGMILLDRNHLGVLDVEVERNAYGRQVETFETDVLAGGTAAAARCSSGLRGSADIGPEVEVLAEIDGEPVLVRQHHLLAAAFHPGDGGRAPRLHQRLLELARARGKGERCRATPNGPPSSGRRTQRRQAQPALRQAPAAGDRGGRAGGRREPPRATPRWPPRWRRPGTTASRSTTSTAPSKAGRRPRPRRGQVRGRPVRGVRPGRGGHDRRGHDRQPQPDRGQEVRHAFSRAGGNLARPGAAWPGSSTAAA